MERKAKKRLSKNKKKTWKKTDVQDVEDHLEDQRLQERTGGLLAEKTDEQLFFVDSTKPVEEPVPAKRSRRDPKPLKCHSALLPDPRIKPARVAHNIRRDNLKRKCAKKVSDIQNDVLSPTRKEALHNQVNAKLNRQTRIRSKKITPHAKFDLWGGEIDQTKQEDDDHFATVTRKKPVKLPSYHNKKPSSLPAVEVALPGASYNPTYDDHQQLLHVANKVEVKKLKVEEKILRQTDHMFPKADKAPTKQDHLQEMSAGLYEEEDDSEGEEDTEYTSINPAVRRDKKKTPQTRRKEKERKAKETQLKLEKLKRKKDTELFRIKSIQKDVTKSIKQHSEKMAKQQTKRAERKDKTQRLGSNKFEAPETELKLSDELVGSLRLLKPEGNLLEDRYKSMQKRNIIEPRKRVKVYRKYKLKDYKKPGHGAQAYMNSYKAKGKK
ncbi:unnamed protein product [Owenia fusiformis]|uniref:Ribosome biogenesis protein NOP53 n=1 Tax=Owenia fusiformis TaxID=6347 RepID=A0A8J1UDB6_OWEFU|nr:unnamed protein product [Owenia fusiformis]